MYVRDNQRLRTNATLSARQIKGEPQVRPGTKTKLGRDNNNFHIQPTQSNFDLESDHNTMS